MAQILGAVLLVMILSSGYQAWNRYQLTAQLTELQDVLREETLRTSEMESRLSRLSESEELRQRLDAAEARLTGSRQVKQFLSETQLGNVDGFSEHFKDLSRAAVEGLSLTEFAFKEGGRVVTLAGNARYSALVPGFVANIEHGRSSLRNAHFSIETERESSESQAFTFILSTTASSTAR
ncbi:MAG: PilN domain-containing protein [Pseudohongiellaceae bacterium]